MAIVQETSRRPVTKALQSSAFTSSHRNFRDNFQPRHFFAISAEIGQVVLQIDDEVVGKKRKPKSNLLLRSYLFLG